MDREHAKKLTANQYVLLAVLNQTIHPATPPLPGLGLPERFGSQREWLSAARALYLERWPGGSNPEWGPEKAIRSVVRNGWVVQVRRGRALVPVLTAIGTDVIAATDPKTVQPKHVEDFLADMRRQRGELSPATDGKTEEDI